MIAVRITCEKDPSRTTAGAPPCAYADLEVDTGRSLDFQIYDQLKPHGWSFNGEQQFCPRHNPELAGLRIALGDTYIEPVPGLRLRLRHPAWNSDGETINAELLLDKTHYDIDQTGAGIWRAKHVSEEWPT